MNYLYANNQECSSGCESGWTLYLDHSSISPYAPFNEENDIPNGRTNRSFTNKLKQFKGEQEEEEEEEEEEETEDEDLSMVSDASSGPPHIHEEERYKDVHGTNGPFHNYHVDASLSGNSLNRQKKKETRRRKVRDPSSLLDDTASSSLVEFSTEVHVDIIDKSFTLTTTQLPVRNLMEEYSQGYSTTQFEVRPQYQGHYDFFQSSLSGNQLQQNQWL